MTTMVAKLSVKWNDLFILYPLLGVPIKCQIINHLRISVAYGEKKNDLTIYDNITMRMLKGKRESHQGDHFQGNNNNDSAKMTTVLRLRSAIISIELAVSVAALCISLT